MNVPGFSLLSEFGRIYQRVALPLGVTVIIGGLIIAAMLQILANETDQQEEQGRRVVDIAAACAMVGIGLVLWPTIMSNLQAWLNVNYLANASISH